jgi:hypothetical protein
MKQVANRALLVGFFMLVSYIAFNGLKSAV